MHNDDLKPYAVEILSRLGDAPPGERPQFLVCHENLALLRSAQGLQVVPVEALPTRLDLAHLIDHTLLKPNATADEVNRLCDEAREHGFASVCINPFWVTRAASRLAGSRVGVCTVVGFPLGASTSRNKAAEAREALANGAREIDMVLAIGPAKAGDWETVRDDLRTVREATPGACLKVILETCLLSDEEKTRACRLAVDEGLEFVKTSTGFSTGGATDADVRLLRRTVGHTAGVKASGGIRTYVDAVRMVLAGATRLGCSASLAISAAADAPDGGY